jgi:ATP-binding cassette subfamily B protein
MITKYYGKNYTVQKLREMCSAVRDGVTLLGISDAAEKLGLKTLGVRINFEKLAENVPLPCIVHWRQEHFVVVYDIRLKGTRKKEQGEGRKKNSYAHTVLRSYGLERAEGEVKVADPAHGLINHLLVSFSISFFRNDITSSFSFKRSSYNSMTLSA